MKVKFLDGKVKEFETLAGADLRGADLCKANMEGADLMCANLEDAELECANLKNANLKGACLEGASLVGANFQDAVLDDEQKAQVTTADDDGEKTQAKRMNEVQDENIRAIVGLGLFLCYCIAFNKNSTEEMERILKKMEEVGLTIKKTEDGNYRLMEKEEK